MIKRSFLMLLVAVVCTLISKAQTKVFSEVSNEVSTVMKTIRQDNSLVGYLAFTELEKASEDSFNYKITIMDENLNDLGVINFRDIKLKLTDVSFEQDVLCLSYVTRSVTKQAGTSKKRSKKNKSEDLKKYAVSLQFIGLDGKIIKTTKAKVADEGVEYSNESPYFRLAYDPQVRNLPGVGFACFFNDKSSHLLAFNAKGDSIWNKKIQSSGNSFLLYTTNNKTYVISQKSMESYSTGTAGNVEVFGFASDNGSAHEKVVLKDKNGNRLDIVSVDKDPNTGNLYIAGQIYNGSKEGSMVNSNQYTKGRIGGLFSMVFTGDGKKDIEKSFSYWGDGAMLPLINEKGRFSELDKSFVVPEVAFRDGNGNTIFAVSKLQRRAKWGAIGASVATSWLIFPPIFIAYFSGYSKTRLEDVVLLKQDAKGNLSVYSTVNCVPESYIGSNFFLMPYHHRSSFKISSEAGSTNYLVISDQKSIHLYNVANKKETRSVARNSGGTITNVYPAKEGYIMVSQYDKAGKRTTLSIEAL